MIDIFGMQIETLDAIALAWFCILWFSYSHFADNLNESNIVKHMHKHRINWMKGMVKREDRLVDIRIIGNLLQSTTFLASTSILIVAGLMAVLGYGEKALDLMEALPFAVHASLYMWVIKTALLLIIFVYSFFKFTWVIRQFNYAAVLIVSAPRAKNDKDKTVDECVQKISAMISNAGRHFNIGVRSYYFGMVALSWYISPVSFIILSTLVIWVLYRREFRSKTLNLLE